MKRRFWLRLCWRSAISNRCNFNSQRFRSSIWASKMESRCEKGLETGNPRVLINCHPPSRPPKHPFKIPKNPPLLVWECIRVHSTMERPVLASLGRDGGFFGGGVQVVMYENPGFHNPGFGNLWTRKPTGKRGTRQRRRGGVKRAKSRRNMLENFEHLTRFGQYPCGLFSSHSCHGLVHALGSLGSVFGRTDFSRILIFGPPDFFCRFCHRIFPLIFLW